MLSCVHHSQLTNLAIMKFIVKIFVLAALLYFVSSTARLYLTPPEHVLRALKFDCSNTQYVPYCL